MNASAKELFGIEAENGEVFTEETLDELSNGKGDDEDE
jgi:hypothetical protein